MFCHFGMNTFHNEEWTDGTKSPATFLPTDFDANQWVTSAKAAGMRYLVVTAKHHEGFSVYPTRQGDYNLQASPWRDGRGDVLRDVADACHAAGIMFGVYISPWDRHDPLYADPPAYDARFKEMLSELLTWYAPVGEVWFDGAGSDGHPYDWEGYYALVREKAPEALIAICGPDIRWVGNEEGIAPETLWNVQELTLPIPGADDVGEKRWWPCECDVPIRKEQWFFHTDGEQQLRSFDELLEIYYCSVGRGATLLLNVSPDRRGLLPEADTNQLLELGSVIEETFRTDLALSGSAVARHIRGEDPRFAARNVIDGCQDSYWTTDDDIHESWIEIDLGDAHAFDRILIQEHLPLGQRIAAHELSLYEQGGWRVVSTGTTIGYKRIHRFPIAHATKVRLSITRSEAAPVIERFGVFKASAREMVRGEHCPQPS